MADQLPPQGVPQFKTAQYAASTQGGNHCGLCGQPLGAAYYRVNANVGCEGCATTALAHEATEKHSAFVWSLVYGIAAAVLGLVLYSAFSIITGIQIGFASLAVGYIVGKAMKTGSRGAGGRRYQIVAALLTYAAVSISAVPISISQSARHAAANREQPAHSTRSASDASGPADSDGATQPAQPRAHVSLGAALIALLALGLASPFLELQNPVNGVIGLVILFVGVRIAWQLMAGVEGGVFGPFANRARTSVSAS